MNYIHIYNGKLELLPISYLGDLRLILHLKFKIEDWLLYLCYVDQLCRVLEPQEQNSQESSTQCLHVYANPILKVTWLSI